MVYFKSAMATVTNASPTQLTVTVPNGAAFGEITVVNKAGGVSGISKQPSIPLSIAEVEPDKLPSNQNSASLFLLYSIREMTDS